MRDSLQSLAKIVLHPLLPHVDRAEQWYISPDSNLWLVPWTALPLADGRFAIEAHKLQFVVSGRDLLTSPFRPNRALGPPIVLLPKSGGRNG